MVHFSHCYRLNFDKPYDSPFSLWWPKWKWLSFHFKQAHTKVLLPINSLSQTFSQEEFFNTNNKEYVLSEYEVIAPFLKDTNLQLVKLSTEVSHCPLLKEYISQKGKGNNNFWIKYNLGQKYYAPQVPPDRGSNSWPPDHGSNISCHWDACSNHLAISDLSRSWQCISCHWVLICTLCIFKC